MNNRRLQICRSRASLLAVLLLCVTCNVYAAADFSTATVSIATTHGARGGGLLFRGPKGCAVLTSRHVVVDAPKVIVTTQNGKEWIGRMGPHNELLDIAVVEPNPGQDSGSTCAPLPDKKSIDQALLGRGILRRLTGAGEPQPINLRAGPSDGSFITFFPDNLGAPIERGTSGFPVYFDGIPVAIQSRTSSQDDVEMAKAARIDVAATILDLSVPTNTDMSLAEATQVLKVAKDERPATDMGQVAALSTLIGYKKGVSGMDLSGISFDNGQLANLQAESTDFTLSTFIGADLKGSNLSRTKLSLSNFTDAGLRASNLSLSTASFPLMVKADFSEADLTSIAWRAPDLQSAKFRKAKLNGASFSFADLRGADFSQATFDNLILAGSDLRGAHFDQITARSIDVTGALFTEETFPETLKPALCATTTTSPVTLLIWETLQPVVKTTSDYSDLFENRSPSLELSFRIDRYFPPCPLRTDLGGTDYDLMIDRPDGKKETFHERMRVELPTQLLKGGGRRDLAIKRVEGAVTRTKMVSRNLATSNSYYTRRAADLLRHTRDLLSKAKVPETMWVDPLTLVLLSHQYNIEPMTGETVIAARWLFEGYREEYLSPVRRNRGNWERLFPPGMIPTDFSPEVQDVVKKWALSAVAALPKRVKVAVVDKENADDFENQLEVLSLDTVMAPYEAALDDANKKRFDERWEDCMTATGFPGPEKAAAQKSMNYYGNSETDCRWHASIKADQKSIFQGTWHTGRTFLRLQTRGAGDWLIAVDQPPPPNLVKNGSDVTLSSALITGVVTKVVQLPKPGRPGVFSYYLADAPVFRVIVLDDVRYDAIEN